MIRSALVFAWSISTMAALAVPQPAIAQMGQRHSTGIGMPERAKVIYRGTWRGTVGKREAKSKPHFRLPSSLSPSSWVDEATRNVRSGPRSSDEQLEGTVTIELTFDGAAVTAHIEGTGGLTPFTLSGLMQGGRCHLRSDSGLEVWEGPCGPDGFSGTVRSTPQNRLNVKGEFQTATTSLVDIEEENRKAAEEKRFADAKSTEEARLNAERQRVAIAKMKASLPKGAETRYEPLLEAAVMEDSKHWFLNRYQPGSVDLLAVKHDKSGAIFLKASFSYAGGSPSWVGAIILKNQLQCLTFPDDPQGCRPIGEGAGGKFGSALMADALAGPGDVDASGCGATCRDYQSWQANKDIYDTYHPN